MLHVISRPALQHRALHSPRSIRRGPVHPCGTSLRPSRGHPRPPCRTTPRSRPVAGVRRSSRRHCPYPTCGRCPPVPAHGGGRSRWRRPARRAPRARHRASSCRPGRRKGRGFASPQPLSAHQAPHELRRRLLHVICPGMEIAVEGELRPHRQVIPVGAPGYTAVGVLQNRKRGGHIRPGAPLRRSVSSRCRPGAVLHRSGFGRTGTFGRVQPHGHGRLGIECGAQRRPLFRPQLERTRAANFSGSVMRRYLFSSASRRAHIFSSTVGSETKSSWSLSTTSTSPS